MRQTLTFLLHWFVRFPLLGIIAALFIAVLVFGAGHAFGIPDLFWHQEQWWKLALNGFSTAIVLFLVCVAGFLLESEATKITIQNYVARTYWILVLFVIAGTIATKREEGESSPWWLLLGHFAGIVFSIVVTWLLMRLAKRLIRRPGVDNAYAVTAKRASPGNRWLHVYATLVLLGFVIVFAILSWMMPSWLPSAVAICIIFCILLLVYGYVRFQFPRERIVVAAGLIVLMAAVGYFKAYKHRFPDLEDFYATTTPIPPFQINAPMPELVDDGVALQNWLASTGEQKPKLAIIATSGGGIRAAVWTTAVLDALTNGAYRIPNFPYHVRIITGASGGMVGAAFYVASLKSPLSRGPVPSATAKARRDLPPMARDSLEPVARSLALRDLPGLIVPFSFHDRGSALEEAWKTNAPIMERAFSSLESGERAGWRPSLIFSPMLVEDGRRLLVSNLDLRFMLENHGPRLGPPPNDPVYSRPSLELFRLMPAARSKIRLAEAARMNASFPWVAPAAELPTSPRRHVVDAGYWDNFGVHTSVAWIQQNMQWLRANTSGVVVIQIRDATSEEADKNLGRALPSFWLRAFDEFLAPAMAALRARESTMTFHNDKDLEQITNASGGFVTTVLIENPNPSVLSWSLTRQQAQQMLDFFQKNPGAPATQRLIALQQWWSR